MTTYGYARVLTRGQSIDAELEALKLAGCERIYQEKKSNNSKDNRTQLKRLLKEIGRGDVIVVSRLDRLARSTIDLLRILQTFRRAGASIKSLHETWADSTSMQGRLFMAIIAGIAEFERELLLSRVANRDANAKSKRSGKLTEHQRRAVRERLDAGDRHRDIARDFNVSHQTIGRIAQQHLMATT